MSKLGSILPMEALSYQNVFLGRIYKLLIHILTRHGCVRYSNWLINKKLLCKTLHNLMSSILSLTMLLNKKKT